MFSAVAPYAIDASQANCSTTRNKSEGVNPSLTQVLRISVDGSTSIPLYNVVVHSLVTNYS